MRTEPPRRSRRTRPTTALAGTSRWGAFLAPGERSCSDGEAEQLAGLARGSRAASRARVERAEVTRADAGGRWPAPVDSDHEAELASRTHS